jgi:hypothetical protein
MTMLLWVGYNGLKHNENEVWGLKHKNMKLHGLNVKKKTSSIKVCFDTLPYSVKVTMLLWVIKIKFEDWNIKL